MCNPTLERIRDRAEAEIEARCQQAETMPKEGGDIILMASVAGIRWVVDLMDEAVPRRGVEEGTTRGA